MFFCLTFKEIQENINESEILNIHEIVSKLPEWDPESETNFICCKINESNVSREFKLKQKRVISDLWFSHDAYLQEDYINAYFSSCALCKVQVEEISEFPQTPFNSNEVENKRLVFCRNLLDENYLYIAARSLCDFAIIEVCNLQKHFIHFRQFVPYVKPFITR